MNIQTTLYWIIGIITATAVVGGAWFYFSLSSTPSSSQLIPQGDGFGVGDSRTVAITPSGSSGAQNTPLSTTATNGSQKIFKVADGPITSATLVQTLHPTTTLARYVLQENGHVLEVVLDNAGVVARAISNTTIPSTARGTWTEKGNGIVLQYLEGSTVKSVYLGFPIAASGTTTKSQTVRIQFLPNNITDLGVSPDGTQVTYLLKTSSGSDGFIAKVDGSASKKLFSTPLSQMLISWPAPKMLLLQTKSAMGTPGAAFSVSTASGAVVPLVYAAGLTAIANQDFTQVVYQTIGNAISSYVHDIKTNKDRPLSFNPIPEKCVLSSKTPSLMYCAAPLGGVLPSYLEEWHQGVASSPDALFSFDIKTGKSSIIAAPGGEDGGVNSDVASLAVSPDDHYLIFVKKGDRSLWALRLTTQ